MTTAPTQPLTPLRLLLGLAVIASRNQQHPSQDQPGTEQLGNDEPGRITRPDSRKGVSRTARQRNGRVGKRRR